MLVSILRGRGKKRTFCCYIDVKKAYDTVWWNGLWKRLWDIGVKGKMWRVLRDMYRDSKCKIRVGGGLTKEFAVEKGVKQGGVLSPLLFSIFINEII